MRTAPPAHTHRLTHKQNVTPIPPFCAITKWLPLCPAPAPQLLCPGHLSKFQVSKNHLPLQEGLNSHLFPLPPFLLDLLPRDGRADYLQFPLTVLFTHFPRPAFLTAHSEKETGKKINWKPGFCGAPETGVLNQKAELSKQLG